MTKKAYAFIGYTSVKPILVPHKIPDTHGKFVPTPNLSEIKLIKGKNFIYKLKTIDGIVSPYLQYIGSESGNFLGSFSISFMFSTSDQQPPTSIYRSVLYKGSNGKFPTKQISTLTASYQLTQNDIRNAGFTGIISLNPGDTLGVYFSNTTKIPANSISIYDYSITVDLIDIKRTPEC